MLFSEALCVSHSEDLEADKEREGGSAVVSGWLFFQYKVNKSWPVIRSLGLGKMTAALQEKGMTRGGGGWKLITIVPPC